MQTPHNTTQCTQESPVHSTISKIYKFPEDYGVYMRTPWTRHPIANGFVSVLFLRREKNTSPRRFLPPRTVEEPFERLVGTLREKLTWNSTCLYRKMFIQGAMLA